MWKSVKSASKHDVWRDSELKGHKMNSSFVWSLPESADQPPGDCCGGWNIKTPTGLGPDSSWIDLSGVCLQLFPAVLSKQLNICGTRQSCCEPSMWQQQAGGWCIHSPWPITIHYTSTPVSSLIVIYSCPVIRPAQKKSWFVYPQCFFSHYVWTRSLRELLCCSPHDHWGAFQPRWRTLPLFS